MGTNNNSNPLITTYKSDLIINNMDYEPLKLLTKSPMKTDSPPKVSKVTFSARVQTVGYGRKNSFCDQHTSNFPARLQGVSNVRY